MTSDSLYNLELRCIKAAHKILHLNYVRIRMHTSYTIYREMKCFNNYLCIVDYGFWLFFFFLYFFLVFHVSKNQHVILL